MKKLIIPKTRTPESVYMFLLTITLLLGVILFSFLGIWGVGILFLILGSTTKLYAEGSVPAYHCVNLVNSFNGNMRVIFPGLNLKYPWESPQVDDKSGGVKFLDLRVELSEPPQVETYPSMDAAMEVKYVYTIRPDISEKFGKDPGEKILTFLSFEASAIKEKGKSLFSQLLSDYYGKKSGKDLLNKAFITETVFGTEDHPKSKIEEFEKKHGVEVTVRVEDSDFPKTTQKFRDMISGAESLAAAIEKLMEKGMDRAQAEKTAKLMNLDGFSEKDINLNVNAPHLTNLQNLTMMGLPEEKKGGKK